MPQALELTYESSRLVLFHGLIGLTLLSLLIASTRSPTRPDQSLAPASANPTSVPAERAEDADDDDVPLRYLRNSQWVTSRVSKDRPSPLPLTSRPRSSSPPSADSDRSTFGISAISPFPFAASPFVPASTEAAGEDEDEAIDEEKEDLRIEGETEGMEGDVDTDRLLPPRKAGRRKVSQQEACFAKSNTGGPRWCKKCDGWKPDRCHHCRWCQRCVLKSERHCSSRPIASLVHHF